MEVLLIVRVMSGAVEPVQNEDEGGEMKMIDKKVLGCESHQSTSRITRVHEAQWYSIDFARSSCIHQRCKAVGDDLDC